MLDARMHYADIKGGTGSRQASSLTLSEHNRANRSYNHEERTLPRILTERACVQRLWTAGTE